jgi:hypothetical protein
MPDTTLLLGPVVFRDFEVPERINFGGTQRLAVHELPGGARVIDALGRDDADIVFSGIFTGGDAMPRARALDELRALGTVLPLTWDVLTYSVVIRAFAAQYERAEWIPFRIACTVLRDEAAALAEAPLSLATSLLGDFSIAAAAALAGGVQLATARTAISAQGATQRASAAHAVASAALADARARIATGLDSAGAEIAADTLTTATALADTDAALERLAQLAQARAYACRAAINLANVTR